MKRFILLAALIILSKIIFGQASSNAQFIENKGQFLSNIDFKLPLNAGDVYFEGNTITYNFYEKGKQTAIRHGDSTLNPITKGHAYKAHFVGANSTCIAKGELKNDNFYNYFLGRL